MTPKYVKEVQELLAQLDNDGNSQDKQPFDTNTPEQKTDVYIEEYEEEQRITLIRKKPYGMPVTSQEEESELSDLDTAPLPTKPKAQPKSYRDAGILPFGVFLTLSCIASIMFQFYVIVNPFTVTVTLAARSQQLTLQGSLQLGRVLNPITVSQSQTAPTTGHGHQDAKQATGFITFYNGQPAQQFVPAGTTLTGTDGVQVITDADATIPAGNPPAYGQVTVPAHTSNSGSAGNIQALDINTTVNAVFVKNLSAFSGGQDERDFQTVTKTDIDNTASPLKANLAQSVQGALQGQLKQGEQLQTLPCSPTVTSDHQPGQEATTVKVTASETCRGIAYNAQELTDKVTQLLTSQEAKKVGAGYSLLESPQVTVTQASSQNTKVVVSFNAQSVWVYALSSAQQHHIKAIIAGKNAQTALQLVRSLPGIESASLKFSGFGDATRLPKNLNTIHLMIVYGL